MSKVINCNQATNQVNKADQYGTPVGTRREQDGNDLELYPENYLEFAPGDRSLQTCIRTIREEQNLTQSSVASMIGIKREAYARVESGKFAVNLDTFERIIDALGYKIRVAKKEDQ